MQTTTQTGGGSLQLLLLLAILIPAILFLLTQQNTLKILRPESRLMNPGLVWLQLIPLFGQVWQFFVVSRIAGSIRKEIESGHEDTLLGIADADAAGELGRRPTLAIGITYCALNAVSIFLNLTLTAGKNSSMEGWVALMGLSSMICWIIYWVQLAGEKKKITRLKLTAV